jgi:hypothetical protein
MANKSFDYGTEVSVETPEGIKLGIICYNWRGSKTNLFTVSFRYKGQQHTKSFSKKTGLPYSDYEAKLERIRVLFE